MPLPISWIKPILAPVMRPAARLIVGVIAVPLLRAVRRRFRPAATWDEEFEKDLEQWFRSSLVLLLATKNVEESISAWMAVKYEIHLEHWYIAAGRLLLAIGVIESMPDQQLFSVIHPGPSRLRWIAGCGWRENIRRQAWPFARGLACIYLSRSSPVYAILTVIFSGREGWIFFWLAIAQYLVIGLVTSRDKALDALAQFDAQMARRRQELMDEFQLPEAHPQVVDADRSSPT